LDPVAFWRKEKKITNKENHQHNRSTIMSNSPYEKFKGNELILRDELAIDRTLLANERTLLAYLRSAVSLVIAGLTILHFAPNGWFSIVGMACIPAGLASGLIGLRRFQVMNKAITMSRRCMDNN